MSSFRTAFKVASAIFGKKKTTRAVKRAVVSRNPRRRRGSGPNGVITKKFCTLEDRIQVPANGFVVGNETFELADMPQFANYVALYEQFRITKIVYKFRSLNPVNAQIISGDYQTLGMVHTVVDHNDSANYAASLAGIQSMMNDSAYKGSKSNRDHVRTIRPMFLTQAGTQTAKSTRGWLNCRDVAGTVNAVSHYGIKWVMEGGYGAAANPVNMLIEPIITYYIQFKNPQ